MMAPTGRGHADARQPNSSSSGASPLALMRSQEQPPPAPRWLAHLGPRPEHGYVELSQAATLASVFPWRFAWAIEPLAFTRRPRPEYLNRWQ